MFFDLNDNILATSTPSGTSFRAIIRLSGKEVFNCLQSFFVPKDYEFITYGKNFYSCQGDIYIEKEKINIPVCVYVMRAPNSYTREDVVEIHTLGSPPLLEILMEKLVSPRNNNNHKADNGEKEISIRIAEPGEFTKRAFLNGRISLAEVESVLHIIRSQTDSELLLAVSNLKGRLGKFLNKIREELIRLSSRIEASIDFSDQDIELVSPDEIEKQLVYIREELNRVVEKKQNQRIYHDGIKAVFVGWPNAGKSSLFNKLLNRSKSIVTPLSGTTRDAMEAVLELEGIKFRIVDTAGIVSSKEGLDSIITKRTYDTLEDAQIILLVIDGGMKHQKEQIDFLNSKIIKNKIMVINKIDLQQEADCKIYSSTKGAFPIVKTSALMGEGLDELKKTMVSSVLKKGIDISASGIVFTMRQNLILRHTLEILEHIIDSLGQDIGCELIAIDLRSVIDSIGEVTGEVVTDDILEIIFSEFCIGK